MKKTITLIILILFVNILLVGCNYTNEEISIRGEITEVKYDVNNNVNFILVEGELYDDTQYDKAMIKISNKTKVLDKSTNKVVPINSLNTNTIIEVVFEGPVAESYPVQAEAKTIYFYE